MTRRKNCSREPDDNVFEVDFSENRKLLFFRVRPHINRRHLYTRSRTRVYEHNEPRIEQITDGINPRNRRRRKREGLTNDFGWNCYTTPRVDGDETNGLVLGTNTIYYIILYTSKHKRSHAFDDNGGAGGGEIRITGFPIGLFDYMGVGRRYISRSSSA